MDTPKSRAYIEKVNSGGFSIRHTSGENLPSSPLLSPQQRARKHASVSPEKPLAGERPRLQRLPASPKLERRKALKFDELLLEEESAWVALLNTTSPADATVVAGSLVRIFATEGRDNSIVKYCIMMEVAAAGAHTVPFRSPGIYSAVVLQSCLHHARIYLHDVLGPVLTDLVHKSNLGFEIDPRYVGTEEVARNLQNLTHVANHLLAAMLISVDLLPIPLRRIYRFAQRCIEGTYPAAAALIPGRLFFTHLVCEALLRPEEHGLAKGKLSDAVMRAHILLAKMLRCVGEETGPSEECMLPLVQWMNKAVTSARRFFKLALNVVATDTLDNHPGLLKLHSLPNPLAKQDRAFLTKFVCDNQVRFRWELVSLQAESALHALRSIVPEKVSPSVMRKVPIPVAEGEGSSTVSSS